jgi:hypothetical protein
MKRALLALAVLSLAAHAGGEPEQDDPIGRTRVRHSEDGARTPEIQLQILRETEAEALKYGLKGGGRSSALRVAGSAWVNIGPTTADLEINGGTYNKVDSGRARKVLVDPRNANIVYFATSGGGVWKTYDALAPIGATAGPHWQPITESVPSLSVGSIAMNPANPDSLVLGLGDPFDVQTPGVVTSDDGGATWSSAAVMTGIYPGTGSVTATSVRDLVFAPSGGKILAATDVGLFQSTQFGVGASWTLVNLDTLGNSVQDCWSVAYAGPGTWLAGCRDDASTPAGHLWRTTNDGLTWTDVTSALGTASTDVGRMTLAAGAQALSGGGWRVYLLAANKVQSDQKDVFRSDNAGATWSSLVMHGCGAGTCTDGAPSNKTSDQRDLNFVHDQASYNQMLVVDPVNPDIVFIGGNLSMGRSTNAGANWTVMTDWLPFPFALATTGGLTDAQYAHADWHTATIAHVGGTAYFYGGHDGGITRAIEPPGGGGVLSGSPGNVPWEDRLNRGIVSHLIYSVVSGKERPVTACAGSGADIVYGGFQDNGTRLRVLTGGTNYVGYNQIIGGDGFGVGLGCVSGGAMGSLLISTYVDTIRVSTDGGGTFTTKVDQTSGLTPSLTMDFSLNFKMKVVADLASDFTYLTPISETASRAHVYRSTDNGNTWNRINGAIHQEVGGAPVAVWPKPMRGVTTHMKVKNLYAAVAGGRVYVTTDGGGNWYESKRAVSTDAVNYLSLFTVAFDPGDLTGNTVWAASPASGLNDGTPIPTGKGHLFKCTGAASTTVAATCLPMSSGIPESVAVNVVKVDPGDSNTIYAGTEIGMYRSVDGGLNISRYGTGLPLVSVTDIAVNADGSAIRVSTFGRGFWEIYPNNAAPGGVAGNGDLDSSGVLDGFDLVLESAMLFSDRLSADYNPVGDLGGGANTIDLTDIDLLIGKLGGRP